MTFSSTDKADEVPTNVFAFQRGSSILKKEPNPPHLRVIASNTYSVKFTSAVGGGPDGTPRQLMKIRHPADPSQEDVQLYDGSNTTNPSFTLVRPGRWSRATEVRRHDGTVAARVKSHRLFSTVHTRWSVETGEGSPLFTFAERARDSLWRRTLGWSTHFDGDALILSAPGFLATALRGPCRLLVKDHAGVRLGLITFCAGLNKPREDFSLYLDNKPYPLADHLLAACVVAAMQRTF